MVQKRMKKNSVFVVVVFFKNLFSFFCFCFFFLLRGWSGKCVHLLFVVN